MDLFGSIFIARMNQKAILLGINFLFIICIKSISLQLKKNSSLILVILLNFTIRHKKKNLWAFVFILVTRHNDPVENLNRKLLIAFQTGGFTTNASNYVKIWIEK